MPFFVQPTKGVDTMVAPHYSDNHTMAQTFLNMGVSTIPIQYRDKRPHFGLLEQTTGTTSWTQFRNRLPTPDDLHTWYEMPTVGVGAIMAFGLGVLDFDDVDSYATWYHAHGHTLALPMAATGRGIHVYFFHDGDETTSLVSLNDKHVGELKLSGYVVTPPSTHKNGRRYRWSYNALDLLPGLKWNSPLVRDVLGPCRVFVPETPQNAENHAKNAVEWKPNDWLANNMTAITDLVHPCHTRGDFAYALCPLHDDNNPSFWMNMSTNTWGCYACGFHNESINTLQQLLTQ